MTSRDIKWKKKNFNSSFGGYVISPKIHVGKSLRFHPDGLFSQQIFGPVKNQCECGRLKYQKLNEQTILCDRCNVLSGPNTLRYETFGKIKLIFPVVKPTKLDILKKLTRKEDIILNPLRAESIINDKRYIAIKFDGSDLKIVRDLENKDNYFPIPFRITGIYSLILTLKYIDKFLKLPIAKTYLDCIISEIRVLPPNVRPIYIESLGGNKNKVQTSEINKHYLSLIQLNRSNIVFTSTIPIDEENWLSKIHYMYQSQILDQDLVEIGVLEYDSITARYQYYVNEIYKFVLEMLSGKFGLIRSEILSRTIEFSARSVIIADPSIKPYQIKVSPNILKRLWLPYFFNFLVNIKKYNYDDCFKFVIDDFKSQDSKDLFLEFLKWAEEE